MEGAEIWCLCAIDRANFAVDSLLIPENWYSGIGFLTNKYRPTRFDKNTVIVGGIFIKFVHVNPESKQQTVGLCSNMSLGTDVPAGKP